MSHSVLRAAFMLLLLSAAQSFSQTFTNLYNFSGSNGEGPQGALVQGLDGNFYGVTWEGGAHGAGMVFKITPAGALTTLYSFSSQPSCADGSQPLGGLVLGTNGNFYGTTSTGGA